VAWGLHSAGPYKRNGVIEFVVRFIRDVELQDTERDLLDNRVQNSRSKAFPQFAWKSEILRQLKKFEKLPAKLLYN